MPAPDRARLERLLGGPELAPLRERLRRRYADTAAPADRFTLTNLSPRERGALAGLLGRPAGRARSMALSHRTLDAALRRAELAGDLRAALESLDGPIPDQRARADAERRAWADTYARAPAGPLAAALADSRFQGVLKRLAGGDVQRAARIVDDAARVLARLPAAGITRSRLAAQVLGDAHGLDNGRAVSTVLQRALDPARELPRPRDVWASQGVMVGELAKPVLSLNLCAAGSGPLDLLVRTAQAGGEPLHLSLRALLRHRPQWRENREVFVCENPDVVAAAADELGAGCPPLVCLDGQLSAAPRTLLDQLDAAGCAFYYHGDFDWAGLAIGNGIVARYRASPWRFSAADYTPAQGPALKGDSVEAVWDRALAPKMRAAGVAVHEEARLGELLGDLGRYCDRL
ncbi:MAG: TIGR02679 family protein [Halioglobus sp.]|nr:TIGR02679 family protein [Halioglobus sp.]